MVHIVFLSHMEDEPLKEVPNCSYVTDSANIK